VWVDTLPPEEREKYQRELKSEERRAVIWLGILAVVVAFDVYLRDDRPPDVFNKAFYYNFFCNSPCSHITFYWVPFLDSLIYFWIGYAVCALLYFSEDILPGKRGTKFIRKPSRRLGHILLAFLPLVTGIYLVLGIASVTLPDYLQTPSVFAVAYLFGQLVIWGIESVTGKKILGKQSVFRKPTEAFLEVAGEGMKIIFEALIHAWRQFLEKRFKHRTTGPLRTRRAFVVLFSTIELVILSIGYFVEHLSITDLGYLFGAPLYALVIVALVVGWYYRRNRKVRDSNQSNPVTSIPEP
jgi:hypothetical protein